MNGPAWRNGEYASSVAEALVVVASRDPSFKANSADTVEVDSFHVGSVSIFSARGRASFTDNRVVDFEVDFDAEPSRFPVSVFDFTTGEPVAAAYSDAIIVRLGFTLAGASAEVLHGVAPRAFRTELRKRLRLAA